MPPGRTTGARAPLGYLPALTGLRGIGAVWVVLYHIFGRAHVGPGYLGVDLFFVLSGFILTYVHRTDFVRYSISSHLRFLQFRLARIYPLHFCILIAFAAVVILVPNFASSFPYPERFEASRFLATLFLVQNWFWAIPSYWNLPSWSLSAEWLAYIFFPITIAISAGTEWKARILLGMIALGASVAALIYLGSAPGLDSLGRSGVIRMAGEFIAGCFLCGFVADPRAEGLPWEAIQYCSLAIIAASLVVTNLVWISPFGFAMVIGSSARSDGLITRVLESKPILFLGEISFSLYLCHWPLITIGNWLTHDKLTTRLDDIALTLFCISGVSYLCWQFIEKPGRKFGRILINGMQQIEARAT